MKNNIKLSILILFAVVITAEVKSQSENVLWYEQPAEFWHQSLPLGNGWLGAMVKGGIQQDTIYLNEETIWSGGKYFKSTPQMREKIPEFRELWFAGKYAEAEALAKKYMTIRNDVRYGSYRPLGNLILTAKGINGEVSNYRRELNIAEAVANTTYKYDGVTYNRKIYVSNPDSVIVVHLLADKSGKINYNVSLQRDLRSNTRAIDDNTLQMEGYTEHGNIKFYSLLKVVVQSGTISAEGNSLEIKGADKATIYITASSNYRNIDPLSKCKSIMASARRKNESTIFENHKKDYQKFYNRVNLHLESSASLLSQSNTGSNLLSSLPTDRRLRLLREGTEEMAEDIGLMALFFNYGRYLLISSSREGTLPAFLQGIWNPLYNPPWFSDYTINVNTQMNYWLTEPCNLSELSYPLFDLIDSVKIQGRMAAKDRYGCRGFVLSSRTTPWYSSELRSGTYGVWQEGAAWLFQQMWDHYKFSGDLEFLKDRVYPTLKELAEFYYDYQVKDPQTGWWVTGPAYSPENMYIFPNSNIDQSSLQGDNISSQNKHFGSLSMGPTMANQMVQDIFDEFIEASEELGLDEKFRAEIIERRKYLPPMQIGKNGQLQEWLRDFDDAYPGHRHMSHLYGLSPSNQITPRTTPELSKAAIKTIELRKENGGGWTGWSSAWMTNFWTRLEDGNKAYYQLKDQLQKCTYDNLFDLHPKGDNTSVFQIDGNFGAANAIANMLLASHTDEIHLLPALPDAFKTGQVEGLRAKGGLTLDIKWKDGKLQSAIVKADRAGKFAFRYGDNDITKTMTPFQDVNLYLSDFNTTKESIMYFEKTITPKLNSSELEGLIFENEAYRIAYNVDGSYSVSSGKRSATFTPTFEVWHNPFLPQLQHGYKYKVEETWRDGTQGGYNYQVPTWDGNTDYYSAKADKYTILPSSVKVDKNKVIFSFPEQEAFELSAELILPAGNDLPKMNYQIIPKNSGYFTVGYVGAESFNEELTDWVWQPLIWTEKRFPLKSYLTMEYQMPIPCILHSVDGTVIGVCADAQELEFRLPEMKNSNFGGLLRNKQGESQPSMFYPVFGMHNSYFEKGEQKDFSVCLYVGDGGWYDTYKHLATEVYGFDDFRKNLPQTMNQTLDNLMDFITDSEYSYWYPDHKTNGYQTDHYGAGRQQSAIYPLSLALVCDNEDMYYKRALPTIEYMLSRKSNLCILDNSEPFMSNTPISTTTDWTAMWLYSNGSDDLFRDVAKKRMGGITTLDKKYKNLDHLDYHNTLLILSDLLMAYRLDEGEKYLKMAKKAADRYIKIRTDVLADNYSNVQSSFWRNLAPTYDIMYELYEETKDEKYLNAAIKGLEAFTTFTYLQPKPPEASFIYNKGNEFRGVSGKEEVAEAWRVSAIGLSPECGGTAHSHRGVFMSSYAAYMLKMATYSNDDFLANIARNAQVGRYTNYPSYAYRHGHNTIHQAPDYPLRPFQELTWTSNIITIQCLWQVI